MSDPTRDIDLSDALLPQNYRVVSVYDLHSLITELYGPKEAAKFKELAVFDRQPEDAGALIEFFAERSDEVSKCYLAKLQESLNAV